MKIKLKALIIGALASVLMSAQFARAEEIVVATDTAFVPFEFKRNGEYIGFDIDVWDAIAKDIGISYKWQPMDFNGIVPAIQTNQVQAALAGISITEPRKNVIDFSDSYYDSGLIIMVPSDNDTIKDVSDLAGKIVAVKTGTAAAIYAKKNFKNTTLRQFPNIDNAYLELNTGRVDAVMHDTPNILYYIQNAGQGKVKAVGTNLQAAQYGIAFPKDSALVAKVNESLKRIKENGVYNEIYKKWFGEMPE